MLDGLWTHVPRELFEPAGRDIYEGRGVGHSLEKSGAPCCGAPEVEVYYGIYLRLSE